MLSASYQNFIDEIKKTVDPKRIYTDPLRTFAYGTDASFYRFVPKVVVRTFNEAEVRAVLAASARYKVPVTFRAAGTSLSGQASTDSVLVLASQGWEKYEVLESGAVIRSQAGIVGARLNQILKPFGRKIGPDPASVGSAMIGGIVANNASGMNGTNENSYRTLRSIRIVLADGTVLDTGSHTSREEFLHTHRDFIARIIELRDAVRANKPLAERILRKYSIKNTTGLSIDPFVHFDDPFDIITHLMVGSEGTLAFISEVEMDTLPLIPYKASAMLYFENIVDACRAVQNLKPLPVDTAELLDRGALHSVENDEGIPAFIKDLPEGATAILLETKAIDPDTLEQNIARVREAVAGLKTLYPIEFTTDPAVYSNYWRIRSGVFPAVGAMRPVGTSCLIEDIVFPVEVLPQAVSELQALLVEHGYKDAVIYGHSIEGNFHFILNQDFATESEVKRFQGLLEAVVEFVVDRYDGSLKGEHGTGRNIAPFVRHEWGEEAYQLMLDVKKLFDPEGLLNQGVIFNDDPLCHIKHLKTLTQTDPNVDKCIECGFCEVNCLTNGFTLSARQRTVIRREISRLKLTGEDPARQAELERAYRYFGNQTCAKDGLCATSCPVKIDTGKLTQDLRQAEASNTAKKIARWTADHFSTVTSGMRVGLKVVNGVHSVLGSSLTGALARGMRKLTFGALPLWTPAMPKGIDKPVQPPVDPACPDKVVYFPSCINQVMGAAKGDPDQEPLHQVFTRLLAKAGYQVIFPKNMGHLCCGTIWESKGFIEEADRKTAELEAALWKASEGGKYPVVCDQSPCLYRMLKKIRGMKLYEPVEFIDRFLMDRLEFTRVPETVAIHITCSMTKMGKADVLRRVAEACAERVFVPSEVGCCGFAGDRGFTYPEMNAFALRKLRRQIQDNGIRHGYSNSRTCEIGLNTNSGIPYQSLVYLVDRCTRPKKG